MKTNHQISSRTFPGAPANTPTPPPYRPSILLADDDSYTRALHARVLTWSGYEVHTADNGEDARKALELQNYDLLITENVMPWVTGFQLLKHLRARGVPMPVIMTSETVPTKELKRHPGLRLEAALRKPVASEKLLQTVKEVLQTAENAVATSRSGLIPPKPMLQTEALASAPRSPRTTVPKRILFVDDEPMMRQLHKEVLSDFGYAVEVAEDGAVAWDALQLQRYDLMITDNEMPVVTGLELMEKLHAAQIALPVIMVSGTMPTEEMRQKKWLPIGAMLHKPYMITDLLKAVKQMLGASSSFYGSAPALRARR